MGAASQEMPWSKALTPVLLRPDMKTSDFLKTTAHCRPLTQPEITKEKHLKLFYVYSKCAQTGQQVFPPSHWDTGGSCQKYLWSRRKRLTRQQRKRRMAAGCVADLCALGDDVSLLWAEVRQDVCGVPLTGVVNSWTSCICIKTTKHVSRKWEQQPDCTLEP